MQHRSFDVNFPPHGQPPKITIQDQPPGRLERKKKSRGLKWTLLILAALFCLGVGIVAAYLTSTTSSIFTDKSKNFAEQVGGLLTLGQSKLQGEKDGQINILVLGIGGENHDGGYLTDSIMIAQVRPEDKQAVTTSIPRDMVVNIPGMQGRKINAVFAEKYLRTKNWDESLATARLAAEDISGLTIPYAVVIDFQGFAKLIDAIGGVEVQVEKEFTDYQYPDGKGGYMKPVTFKAGVEKMTGERALIYSRSRHASGSEGSDFARSKRQQQIIQAAKTKILSSAILTSPTSINKILQTAASHVHTNLQPQDLWRMYNLTKQAEIFSQALTPETGLLCARIQESTGAYILATCAGKDEDDIKSFFKTSFTSAKVGQEKPRILLTGTNAFGPTARTEILQMETVGATVTQLNYSDIKPSEMIFYQLNSKPATSSYLKETFKAKEVALPPPGLKIDREKYDLIIVIKDPSKTDAEILSRQKAQEERAKAEAETEEQSPAQESQEEEQ